MKKCLFLLIMTMNVFLSGCWDSTEMNDIAIVTGIAIDPGDERKYKMTVGYVNPRQFSKQSPEPGAPVTSLSLEGDSLPEMSVKMNIGISRILKFSHTRVVYINEKIAREGVGPFLDEIERSPEFRNDFNILITKGDEAAKFTQVNDNIEKVPSLKVQKQTKSLVETWGGDPRIRLTDFINAIVSKGRAPVASTAVIKGSPEKGKSTDSNNNIKPEATVELDGMAVFDMDKLIGYLTLEDTRNYLWTQNLKQTMVTTPCSDNEEKFFDLLITKNKTTLKTNYRGDTPVLQVKIHAESNLNSMQCAKDLTKMKTYSEIEKVAENHIKNMVEATIKKVQKEYGVDIFGFGEELNRQHYQKAKEIGNQWDKEFARADVEVHAQVAIRRTGTRTKSFLSEVAP
ncbi:Ger(x)C family spore germination protein [Robertmurraya andreesenii]|uniref:Spore germination protein KC n=1 Tax=Anoxybacillus andreesenii TaxID=1325932 RepID=A0ABT9V3K1_9BACL|nr:Ger(x)C family spore germination protein [Robertmurraya andreesenii]MDQ0155529.1 spore germination protein KC [Robertmurraya andreesenii]